MANLRILQVVVVDSTNITTTFTDTLSEDIGVSNITIAAQTPGVPDPEVLIVASVGNQLQIQIQPLTPLAAYFITFKSVPGSPFQSLNGTASILNDGQTNVQLIIGPVENDNPIKNYLTNYFNDGVYNVSAPSIISNYIDALSNVLAQSLYDIRQVKNENYLSYTITDEPHQRGAGAFDRLNEEAAYEILRVGTAPTGTTASFISNTPSFPTYLVSLRATPNTENLTPSIAATDGTFNLQNLVLNLSKQYVIMMTSLVFVYQASSYIYNIDGYGYQLLDSNYDPDFAFTYLVLENNQIQLNQAILADPNFSTEGIQYVQVNYQYKDMGRNIDPTSLIIDTVLPSGREVVPPLENIFTLQNAPIVTSTDQAGTVGDVTFIDPNAVPGSNTPHPAFTMEVPFSNSYIPAIPGQYSVDYTNGMVYVYGATSSNDGTGAFPPLAVYLYRHTFVENIDYVYDQITEDISALSTGSLIEANANIYYRYEYVLAPGVDYNVASHVEVLNEFIGNKLLALNCIQPTNFPLTDVFQIYNQTTGEIYPVSRWNDTQIFFTYNKAPSLLPESGERASFQNVLNEFLFVSTSQFISNSTQIFQIFLANNNIIAATEDCIASSINTSANFSDQNVFIRERYFDNFLSVAENNTRLVNIGDYQIDYVNGVVWCLTGSNQTFNIGTVSYKRGYIVPQFPHVIIVNNIYYRFSAQAQIVKTFDYTSFSDGQIIPSSFDSSNEEFLNANIAYPYILDGYQVGTFEAEADFVPGVTNYVKFVRGLFEYIDVANNPSPINFATSSSANGKDITTDPLIYNEYHSIQFDGTNYYVLANTNLLYQSSNITLEIEIVRLSDKAVLWSSSNPGTIVLGSPLKLILSGSNTPHAGDAVILTYSYTITNFSRIVVDYNKGDYFIDYVYLHDEIIISYEYGDNSLDFRQSSALSTGQQYYVTYSVGALRDALLKNFGTLIDIPILNSLDLSLPRERYRDALTAAIQSFVTGPSLTAIKSIVSKIVHTPPQVIESAFQNWTIGAGLLNPEPIQTTGSFSLVPAKFGNGVVVNAFGQEISMPLSSNIRLEQGTLECWVSPLWNGIDNKAEVTFTITKDGYALSPQNIFIGPRGFHPTIPYGGTSFSVNTQNLIDVLGKPNESKDGVFIYYAPDSSGTFNRWYIHVKDSSWDGYMGGADGYFDGYVGKTYSIKAKTSGKFYDVKSTIIPQPASSSIASGTNSFTLNISEEAAVAQGITFVADNQHFIVDAGEEKCNRLSIFKDESGYLNFRVIDKNGRISTVSSDVSSWQAGQLHQVAVSWAMATKLGHDEIHLFIDGFEVPNIIKYGNKVVPYLHEKYRTINPEEIVGMIPRNIVGSTDLTTVFNSNSVSSSLNFNAYGILPGDTIYVEEPGFNTNGYTINTVNGQTLILASVMPQTTTLSSFTINKVTFDVQTEIDLYPNIAVSLLHSSITGSDLVVMMNSNVVNSPSTNFTTLGVQVGSLIQINAPAQSFPYTIVAVSGHNITITDNLPTSFSGITYQIYPNNPIEISGVRALSPSYELGRDGYCNSTLTIINNALSNDIVLINTLGLNNRLLDYKYYVWNNPVDGYVSNTIMTKLPTPIILCDAKITHWLLSPINIGPGNSTLVGSQFISNNISTDQPSISDNGRTLAVNLVGDNISYSPTAATVTLHGTSGGNSSFTETLTFTGDGTVNTTSRFSQVSYITVSCTPVNPTQNCAVVYIKELYPITYPEASITVPVIRYSYQMEVGNTLKGTIGTNVVTDENGFFSYEDIGNYLIITYPASAAVGQYQITGISTDHLSLFLATNLPASINGNGQYQVLNVSDYRSGLQNGFFTFENATMPGVPYNLVQGTYEFNYYTYLSIPFDVSKNSPKLFIGTDINGLNFADATIDELQILAEKITDTRIGETVALNQESITKDFNSLVPFTIKENQLVLCHFDTFPFINSANIYINNSDQFIQTSEAVNVNFSKSICLTNNPYVIDNTGILSSHSQGTIEFWVNPLFDTGNDPNYRYYFDASAIVSYRTISSNNVEVKVVGQISQVLSVKLQVGDGNVDYFAGGTIASDNQTIILNRRLPNQQTPVIVSYIPTGVQGDRISIYKDPAGYINFDVRANDIDYVVRSPAYWEKGSWHRLKATFSFNEGIGSDQIHFFVDGYERGNVLFGNGLLFGQGQVFGSSFPGAGGVFASILFRDSINELFIGSDYTGTNNAYALIDNLRISNIARPLFKPFGESIDVNYSPNLSVVFPVASDLYTTLLLNFDTIMHENTSFATLKNRETGNTDFQINVYDNFDILSSNPMIKTILETLIDTLSPANSRPLISYLID